MSAKLQIYLTAAVATTLLFAACTGSDIQVDASEEAPAATASVATTAPLATAAVEPTASEAEPTVAPEPEPTAEPEPAVAAEPEFVPAQSIVLDDVMWAQEPVDVSYRASLVFTLRAELADGSVQEGIITGEGGKLTQPIDTHAMVVVANEFGTIPSCIDLATISPDYTSAYFTFWGGLSDQEGGDLMGEAALLEAGIESNGVTVDRYGITLDNIDPEDADEYVDFDQAFIDIARDGQFVVRVVLNGLGFNNSFAIDQSEPRSVTYDLNFSEFGTFEQFVPVQECL